MNNPRRSEWHTLVGVRVDVWKGGKFLRTGVVEIAAASGTTAWIGADGIEARMMMKRMLVMKFRRPTCSRVHARVPTSQSGAFIHAAHAVAGSERPGESSVQAPMPSYAIEDTSGFPSGEFTSMAWEGWWHRGDDRPQTAWGSALSTEQTRPTRAEAQINMPST